MDKQKYEKPEMQIDIFETEDIMVGSGNELPPDPLNLLNLQ